MKTPPANRNGFTLVELLVVITIIVTLLAILLPSMGRAIDASQRAVCLSNQHQLQIAAMTYVADYAGFLPYRGPSAPADPSSLHHTGATDLRPLWSRYIGGYTIEEGSDVFYCPSTGGMRVAQGDTFVLGGGTTNQGWGFKVGSTTYWVTSYAYYANYNGPWVKLDPVPFERITAKSNLTLFSDTIRRDGWNQLTGNHSVNGGAIPHASWPKPPSGANAVRLDGSAAWFDFTGYDDTSGTSPFVKYIEGSVSMGFWWPRYR